MNNDDIIKQLQEENSKLKLIMKKIKRNTKPVSRIIKRKLIIKVIIFLRRNKKKNTLEEHI